jgi:oligopeptidase A
MSDITTPSARPSSETNNPLLAFHDLPRFDIIRPEHAEPAIRHILAEADEQLTQLESGHLPTWDGLMAPLYRLGEPLDFAWGLVHHYLGVLNDPAWRTAQEALQPQVVAFSLRVRQSEPLYRGMKSLRDGANGATLSGPRRRILDAAILGAELGGIGLAPAERQRFNAIQTRLAECSTRFSNNLLDATKAFTHLLTAPSDVEGLPPSLRQVMAQGARQAGHPTASPETGPWRLSLEQSVLMPFLQYSARRDLRELLYRAHITRASSGDGNNAPLVAEILNLRRDMARLLGFRAYAEVSLARKMAPSVAAVDTLLADLAAAARPHALRDLADLQTFADAHGGPPEPLRHWDIAYWAERMRASLFDFSDEDLRPYFQFPHVLDGLFALTRRLFNVSIVTVPTTAPAPVPDREGRVPPRPSPRTEPPIPVWHPDVRVFRIHDHAGAPLATFFLDPYSRPETKRGGAWMDPVLPRNGVRPGPPRLPLAYLVCNQTVPVDGKPSLMTFSEVETLFHEFGHGLQHLLTTVDEPDAAGLNNIEWDAVELASQFMENWCYDRGTLKGLSRHVDSGEPLPDALFEKITRARRFRAGSDVLRQVLFAMSDMELHARHQPGGAESAEDAHRRIAAAIAILQPLPEDRTLCGFAHIFAGGYAAGYYSYKWAEVLAADAFAAFEEAGLDNPAALAPVATRFRNTILALGGGAHPAEVFRAFRGRDPSPNALLMQYGLTDG